MIWLILAGAFIFGLYVGNKIARHIINTIIIWALIGVEKVAWGLRWCFQKLDGIGRVKKTSEVVTKTTKSQNVANGDITTEEQIREIFKGKDITITPANKQ